MRTWQAAYAHVFEQERLDALDLGTWEERWSRRLAEPAPPSQALLVAEEGGSVVGFAACGESRETPGEGELYAIYALPESWGSGVGPALMAAALDALRDGGFASASLWVLEDNPRARRFYEREGWTLDGGRREEQFLGAPVTEVRYRITLG